MISEMAEKFLSTDRGGRRRNWVEEIQCLGAGLKELAHSSEQEFLTLGSRLEDFSMRAGSLSRLSGSVASGLTGEEMAEAIKSLRNILELIQDMDGKTDAGAKNITLMVNRLNHLQSLVTGFDHIVRRLHASGHFIRIENTRLGRNDTGFNTLAQDIRNLAVNIETKAAHLEEQSVFMGRTLERNLETVKILSGTQRERARLIMSGVSSGLGVLEARRQRSAEMMNGISVQWEAIRNHMGEAVMSMQFHDITRQRLEHAAETIGCVASELSGCPAHESAGLLRRMLKKVQGSGVETVSEWDAALGRSVVTCELQKAQIHHTREEFVMAVERILMRLSDIVRSVQRIDAETREIVLVGHGSQDSFLSDLEKDMKILADVVADYVAAQNEFRHLNDRLADAVRSMSVFIREIEHIGIVMRTIALNAIIHAARIGSDGAGLGVLAESVHELSVGAIERIEKISALLSQMVRDAADLSQTSASIAMECGSGDGRDIKSVIAGAAGPLRRLNDTMTGHIDAVGREGERLIGDIRFAIAGVSVHVVLDQGLRDLYGGLDALQADVRRYLPAAGISTIDDDLKVFAEQYTMDREREVHRSVVMAATGTAAALGSSGMRETAEHDPADRIPLREGGSEDLGDNVELF